jgi:hypothetical protein
VYPNGRVGYHACTRHTYGSRYFHSYIRPVLATRSGDAPRIGIHSPDVGNTLGRCASHWHLFAQRWQHARGLRLAIAFIRPALATRSGAAPRIGIYSPDIGNMLGGCASHWHLFARCWQHARGLRLALALLHSPDVGNTLGGCASYWHSYIHPTLATRSGATLTC